MRARTRLIVLLSSLSGAALLPAAPVLAEPAASDAPLRGKAWQLADEGYKAYDKGSYAKAQARAQAAIRLRPDVAQLHLLLIYSLQKQGKLAQAERAVAAASAAGADSPALREAHAALRDSAQGSAAPATQAFRTGFPFATQAYAAYNDGDYNTAAAAAQRAFAADPSQGAWALLWQDALAAQGDDKEALRAIEHALAAGAPNRSDLIARRQGLLRQMSVPSAQAGYQALIANRPADAIAPARKAVALAPDTASHRLLLVTALMLDEQLAEAESAAGEALRQDSEDTVALLMRAYLRQRQGKTAQAEADFDSALGQDWLDDEQRHNVRLIAADAALAAGNGQRVQALLAALDGKDKAVRRRLDEAGRARAPKAALTLASFPPPVQHCRDTPYGTACELLPADASGGSPAALAYAAYGRHDYQEAIAQARKAVEHDAGEQSQALLTTALAAGNRMQAREAATRLNTALERQAGDAGLLMQRAYVNQRLGMPEQALRDIQAARATGKVPPLAILDEGYARAGAGDKRGATQTLMQAIDQADAGALALDEEQRYNTRGAIAGFAREWGGYVSAAYRGARPAAADFGGAAISTPGDAAFGTAEIFWRPPAFLNTSNRTFELYGRLSSTIYDNGGKTHAQRLSDPCGGAAAAHTDLGESHSRGIAGVPTTVGALGLRFTPSNEVGLTFGLERQFLLGTATRSGMLIPADASQRCALNRQNQSARYEADAGSGGWLTYVTYGIYEGSGLRLDVPSWFTVEGYVQGGYSLQDIAARYALRDNSTGAETASGSGRLRRDQAFAAGEIRAGRSLRLDAIDERLILFPYVVLGADWLWQKNRASGTLGTVSGSTGLQGSGATWSIGAGPGFNLRYWFRQDRYNAPRSYLDWGVQYRAGLAGHSNRAKGLFMNLTLSY